MLGCVLQDRNEEVAKGGHTINASSAVQTKVLAIFLSIKESLNLKKLNLEVWTNSKILVDGLCETKKAASSSKTIIFDIQELVKNFNSIRILNVSREKVSKAHLIAVKVRKEGIRL